MQNMLHMQHTCVAMLYKKERERERERERRERQTETDRHRQTDDRLNIKQVAQGQRWGGTVGWSGGVYSYTEFERRTQYSPIFPAHTK